MLLIKKGNLLEATENIICHQCNTGGTFGGGLAFQIAKQYPECEASAINHVNRIKNGCEKGVCNYRLLGTFNTYKISDKKVIINCFTQNEDYTTNYDALKEVFMRLKLECEDLNLSIAIPYGYGCGIASGDWKTIENILIDIFDDYDIVIYKMNTFDKNKIKAQEFELTRDEARCYFNNNQTDNNALIFFNLDLCDKCKNVEFEEDLKLIDDEMLCPNCREDMR